MCYKITKRSCAIAALIFCSVISTSYFTNAAPMVMREEKAKSVRTIFKERLAKQKEVKKSYNPQAIPQFVPGEVIVKLKEKASRQTLLDQKYSIRKQAQQKALFRLKAKYRFLKGEKPVFKYLHKRLEPQDLSQTELKTNIGIKFPIRYKRASKQKKANVDLLPIYLLKTEKDVLITCDELSQDPDVEYAHPNYIYEMRSTPLPAESYIPNDYYVKDGFNPAYWREGSWGQGYPDLWGLGNIQAVEAYNLFDTNQNGIIGGGETLPGEGIVVAVIDSGVDYNHEDLAGAIWTNGDEIPNNSMDDDGNGYIDDCRGYDISDDDNDPTDYMGHGTHVAGTIAAKGDNTVGIIGIAPGAKIMPVKGFPNAYSSVMAEAIRYAADNGADVLSNSWGFKSRHPSDPTIEGAIDYAYTTGCVIVFAAGNSNDDIAYYSPNNQPHVINVAATDYNDQKASFSNWGDGIDVAAPGVEVLSLRAAGTDIYGGGDHIVDTVYYRSNGTSMACPHASGLAALILSKAPALDNEGVRHIMRLSADDIGAPGFDIYSGAGRINAKNAVLLADAVRADQSAPVILTDSIAANTAVPIGEGGQVAITWQTDEDSTSTVYYGTVMPPLSSTATSGYVTGHVVTLTGLDLNTRYYFYVKSKDLAGNIAQDDNSGNFYSFTIIPPEINVIPLTFSFTALEGATDPTNPVIGTFTISNTAGFSACNLLYDIPQPSQNWLTVSNAKGEVAPGMPYIASVAADPKNLSAGAYSGEILINHNVPSVSPITISVDVTVLPAQAIHYKNHIIADDWSGRAFMVNGDGQLNPGERSELKVEVENFGTLSAQGVSATLSLAQADSYMTILDNTVDWGDILAGAAGVLPDSFLIEASSDAPDGHITAVALDITDSAGNLWHEEFQLRIVRDIAVRTSGNTRINTDEPGAGYSFAPKIGSNNTGNICIVWDERRNGTGGMFQGDVYSNASQKSGNTWRQDHGGTDIQLNTPGAAGFVYGSWYGPQMSNDDNGNVYAVWYDERYEDIGGSVVRKTSIRFNVSHDNGDTWLGNDIRIDNVPTSSAQLFGMPQIANDNNGNVYVVWQDSRLFNPGGTRHLNGIYLNVSHDYGATWLLRDIRLDDTPTAAYTNGYKITCNNNGGVYVVWASSRNDPDPLDSDYISDIFLNYSHDEGGTWLQDYDPDIFSIQLNSSTLGYSNWPGIASDNNGNIYVAWENVEEVVTDPVFGEVVKSEAIRFNRSADSGATWLQDYGGTEIKIDLDGVENGMSFYPQVTCSNDGGVYVTWLDFRRSPSYVSSLEDIYFNSSIDYGATWQAEDIRLDRGDIGTFEAWLNPEIDCDDNGNVYVVWNDNRNVNDEFNDDLSVFFNYSTDKGFNWQADDIRLDTSNGQWLSLGPGPTISSDNSGKAYVAWSDYRNGKNDIFFTSIALRPELSLVNDPLVIKEGEPLEVAVTAKSPDGTQLSLFLDVQGLPKELLDNLAGAVFAESFNPITGETIGNFSWTPGQGTMGNYYPVVFVAKDNNGLSAYQAVTINVLSSDNQPPVLEPIGDRLGVEGQLLVIGILAIDPDGDPLELTAKQANGNPIERLGASFVDYGDGSGTFTWTPDYQQAGNHQITFTATHIGYVSVSETINIGIAPVPNNAPQLGAIPGPITVYQGQEITFSFTASDPDGDDFGVCIGSGPGMVTSPQDAAGAWSAVQLNPDGTFIDYPHNGPGPFTFNWTALDPAPPEGVLLKLWAVDDKFDISAVSTTINVMADKESPVIDINSIIPSDGSYTNDVKQSFYAEVSDNAQLDSATVVLDIRGSPSPYFKVFDLNGATDSVNLTLPAGMELNESQHSYYMNVKDVNGNISAVEVNFTVDTTPPVITITSPTWNEWVINKYATCTFTLTDNVGLSRVRIGMLDHGVFEDITLNGETTFTYTYDPKLDNPIPDVFPLNYNWYYYYVVEVWDISGNRTYKYAIFRQMSGGGGGRGCFLPGTPVLLPDGSTKAIETLKVGDTILAYDEETKEFKQDQVKHVFVFPEEEGYFVINNHIKVTPHHRFLVERRRRDGSGAKPRPVPSILTWKEAGELKLGDRLFRGDTFPKSAQNESENVPSYGASSELIASIEYIQEPVPVYNLEVNPYHIFIAGGVVVHNARLAVSSKSGPITK